MVSIICNQIYFLHMMKVKEEVIQRNYRPIKTQQIRFEKVGGLCI